MATKTTMWKKVAYGVVSTAFAASLFGGTLQRVQADPADQANPNVQLVCDEDNVAAGGTLTYHILYHEVQNKHHDNVTLKVQIPDGCDVDLSDIGGQAVWDATTRTVSWHLTNVEAGGATVLQFHLNVHTDIQVGKEFDLSCSCDEDGDDHDTPPVKVVCGPQVDQPFFVGYDDGLFHPNASITRAQAAAVVARVKGLVDTSVPAHAYTDVSSSSWAYNYINEVTNAGYMIGYTDGTFHPNDPITRAELVRLVLELRGVHPIPVNGFADTKGNPMQDVVGTAKGLGFVQGYDNKFDPNGPTERQAAATMFDVALQRGPLENGDVQVVQHFPDLPRNAWSFGYVEEASKVAHKSEHRGNGEYLLEYLPAQTQPL